MKNEIFGLPVEIKPWKHKGSLPIYIEDGYEFSTASITDTRCTIAQPTGDVQTLPALKKQLAKIYEADNAPVVLELKQLSPHKKKALIKNNIAFVTNKQAYLPFLGAILTNESETRVKSDKFYMSTQELFLHYLYANKKQFIAKDALEVLPFTTMTLSRAVRQLEATGLFNVTKVGVSNVIESEYDRLELFEKARPYLSSPVRTSGYIDKTGVRANMVLAGESALAKKSMLNSGKLATLAIYEKNFDKTRLTDELIDPAKQVKLELWRYEPVQFSKQACGDVLSVALSFKNTKNERIEQAVEEIVIRELGE